MRWSGKDSLKSAGEEISCAIAGKIEPRSKTSQCKAGLCWNIRAAKRPTCQYQLNNRGYTMR
jgi:hypothetical protein